MEFRVVGEGKIDNLLTNIGTKRHRNYVIELKTDCPRSSPIRNDSRSPRRIRFAMLRGHRSAAHQSTASGPRVTPYWFDAFSSRQRVLPSRWPASASR